VLKFKNKFGRLRVKFINPVYRYLKLLTTQVLGKRYVIEKQRAQFLSKLSSVLDSASQKSIHLAKIFEKVFSSCKNAGLFYFPTQH
jgi:hypothetical protein